MANFYRDNDDIQFHVKDIRLAPIIGMLEDDFVKKDNFAEAPKDIDDALDNYERVLEIVGDIAGSFIALRAKQVDRDGARLIDGEVHYAPGTEEALECLRRSELMGFTLPRTYGGLNLPKTIYAAAIEIVSRADAALMNLFGLQEIADTIYRFGSEDQKHRYLPRFCRGEVLGAMALTEPNAGSDTQAVMLKATQNADGSWYLNGVKRFITNGCAHISLVLARSEEGVSGARGLSLFIYERDKNIRIRRIEDKLGIHGSPTCEMQFNDAPAELLGQRRFGLIKYAMALMNGARLAVAAQALGIAEAAYREAVDYAASRIQFGKPIRFIPAVCEILTDMKVAIEAGRSLLYETARIIDTKECLEKSSEKSPERKGLLQEELKRYTRYAALFTPMLKVYATETGNKICYDALQVHGGNGYTEDYAIERHYRDIRVTNIYEGTTQLQVVQAIGGIITGVIFERFDAYEKIHDFTAVDNLFNKVKELRKYLETTLQYIKDKNDKIVQEFHERRIVEIATDVILSYLLCIDALRSDRKKLIADLFINKAKARIKGTIEYIFTHEYYPLQFHDIVIN